MDVIPAYEAVIVRNTNSPPDFLHTATFVSDVEHITKDTGFVAGHEGWPKLHTSLAFSRMIFSVGSIHNVLVEGEAVLILGESGRRGRGYREIEAMRILNIIILPPEGNTTRCMERRHTSRQRPSRTQAKPILACPPGLIHACPPGLELRRAACQSIPVED